MLNNQIVLKQAELCGRQFAVYGTPENPLFKAQDVASIIGHSNISVMLSLVDNDEKGVKQLLTPGGNQQVWMLTEDGLYEILMQSRKPIAKQFKKEVKKILHDVRTTGGYIAAKQDESPEVIMARALQIANETIERSKQQLQMLEGENANLQEQNRILAPKAQYTDEVLQSNSTYTLTQVAHDLWMRSVHSLISELTRLRILFKQSGQYQPTAKVAQKGYFKTRTAKYIKPDGSIGTSLSTVVTERGRVYLHSVFSK
ncbi:MAG: phage antirepressor KilAC domain-containing protein [Bacteroidales bacterium]